MLSILIPTYNYVCVKLVTDLQQQAERLECPYEILVADDASEEAFKCENRKINGIPGCKYIELQENVGRSRIRNILGHLARYDYLIFMDCDASVVGSDFLSRYMAVRNAAEVVYGGLVHPEQLPSPEVSLAYLYEKNAEPHFTAEKRALHPYKVFRTFNFMILRETFLKHPLMKPSRTTGMKTLYRIGIKKRRHQNPAYRQSFDELWLRYDLNVLRKTEESLRTLYVHRKKLEGSSEMLRLYGILQRLHLVSFVFLLFRLCEPMLRRNLYGRHPNLYFFAFYKIGYYCNFAKGGK